MLLETKNNTSQYDQYYFGRGKLLLTGEYFVIDGAKALALPVQVGQSLTVEYSQSYNPELRWRSFDVTGKLWLDASFEFWRFNLKTENPSKEILQLQMILRQARKQNPHFLRDDSNIEVTTKLGFPLEWGLGSSATLIYNIAQWAYISPFELLFNTYGGSGYDIACAQSNSPLLYEKGASGPKWSLVDFKPPFHEQLYFVYLGKKQSSADAIKYYRHNSPQKAEVIMAVSALTDEILKAQTLEEFEFFITAHEDIVGKNLHLQTVKDKLFSDYWGSIKSLGAWGGDFILVSSNRDYHETKKYFESKDFNTFIQYNDMIMTPKELGHETVKKTDNEFIQ